MAMPANETAVFFNSSDYQAGFRGATINLVFTGPGIFTARLTTVSLPHLRLYSVQESLPRIAYVALAPDSVNFAFPAPPNTSLVWGALKMKPRDLMFHSLGERMHQCTGGASGWSIISVDRKFFAGSTRALIGSEISPPRVARVIRPLQTDAVELHRLHAKACRLAETHPRTVGHREVARAIEHDIIYTLVKCLTAGVEHEDTARRLHCAIIMNRLEDELATKHERKILIPELCEVIGVAERTLRNYCLDVLGIGPKQYFRLRRLNLLRVALQRADPETAKVSEIADRYGFSEFGRLAGFYRTIFGETPSATLRRPEHKIRKNIQYAETS
jgi:AraC-like DNA-binding protein